ncbi:MAG: hypothetical protein PHO94_04250 [Petrimonas sp.]|nr:hypothetical protein [Petrimonas sp.]
MKEKYVYFIFYLLFATVGGILFFFLFNDVATRQKQYDIVENESEIQGVILKLFNEHGHSFIVLTNNKKILIPISSNFMYDPDGFVSIALTGDSIIKQANNDTIYIVKDNKKYLFELGTAINTSYARKDRIKVFPAKR